MSKILSFAELSKERQQEATDFFNAIDGGYFFYRGKLCNLNRTVRWGTPWSGPAPKWAEGTHGYFTTGYEVVALTIFDDWREGLSLYFTTP